MSNAKQPKMDTFEAFVKEVEKPPYKMLLPDGEILTVHQPTGRQAIEATELAESGVGSVLAQLRSVLGHEAWEQFKPHVMDAPGEVLDPIFRKIMKHFGYDLEGDGSGEEVSPS